MSERPAVDVDRLLGRLAALGEIGAIDGGGVCRLALTDADREGRDLVVTWMHDLGLRVDVDGIGNVTATWPPDRLDPPVLMGSHIDTVATGGRYDGNLGVLAGLEVIEAVIAAGVATTHPLAVAFFTNEEGSRFAPDMLGSLVHVGGLDVETAHDTIAVDGARLGDELARVGYVGTQPTPAAAPHAYVELHIEQGPVLEAEGITIGAVTGVQGISWQEVTITGQANHAGTTPMGLRHDAGWAAARLATFVRELALDLGDPQVGTVGRIDLHPDLVNVIAARAVLTVDLRNTDDAVLGEAERRVDTFCDELAAAEGVTITRRELARFEPVEFDPRIVDLVEEVAVAHGRTVKRLPSGAGHDAQMLARVCPAGMVFTPSVAGISHNPAERTEPNDIGAGAGVLLDVVLRLAGAVEQPPYLDEAPPA
ncbi:MAG: putative N-carbamoyl-L-amino acid amidohydrolase [Acidimicrobiales bacterium]|nr:putative N-carbamoyl-L-amino acid amidohydrolase [Acidimicrobiales bacterium]